MMLYHGTGAGCLAKMIAEGIAPRAITKAKDNWKHTVTSNKDAVYLTTAYAWHFAAHASQSGTQGYLKDKRGLIIEIDRSFLQPWLLCPDEDFLEQATRKFGPKDNEAFCPTDWPMAKRTRYYRKHARYNTQHAELSLENMGTAAYYGTIPWTAVTRYVLIDWGKLDPGIYLQAVDSMVSMLNHRILSARHAAFTKWFFGDPVRPQELTGATYSVPTGDDVPEAIRRVDELQKGRIEYMAKAMAMREGLEVVNCK